jgi:prevent-host-death family protein
MYTTTMTRIPVTEARPHFAELVARVEYRREKIILTKHGRDVAMLVPVELPLQGMGPSMANLPRMPSRGRKTRSRKG